MAQNSDPLWPLFAPLWTELRAVSPGLLLAGGYALFLKQQWLISQSHLNLGNHVAPFISIERWLDPTPRATNDLDFVVGVEIIASRGEQQSFDAALKKHGFRVVPENRLWQFSKAISAETELKIDFHAAPPSSDRADVRVEARRVKPNPSLAQLGIHGRENAEAAGCEWHPFRFEIDHVEIAIPNAVTLSVMKLVAALEKRLKSLEARRSPAERNILEAESHKHARDVFRVIAMLTREENDLVPQIVARFRPMSSFRNAANAFHLMFVSDEQWAAPIVASQWQPADYELIRNLLAQWLSHAESQS
ncbi:hypothetical protein [Anatilimnocola floriformis]|uniref:hypothetical protein n=1 Tax=Anatilimnocola floriformis TaxID=2948575 RepID=UPI0020C47EF6|nr:hypothetical protein [Anatilimnocola floriformis]